ncbi:MAG: 3-deoxy-D-manno-octulosonic acid transferase, partial [Muribaculaceae bacterium]|nr:3-deoxy-D-manno-octulosonic acid transferase [Muribaculaceae bacterium]
EFEADRLRRMKYLFGEGCVLMSEAEKNPELIEGSKVLIIDCFGLLSSAYAYCDVAYVGGGFGAGLHNINEAAVYDVPVIYGPNNAKFIEAREMAESGGGFPIASKEDFEKIADILMLNNDASAEARKETGRKAGDYIRSKLGATEKIFNIIFENT